MTPRANRPADLFAGQRSSERRRHPAWPRETCVLRYERLESRALLTATLGTAALVEGPVAGSDSDLLVQSLSTTSWMVSANDSWLHVAASSASGTGSATVAFSFDANTGTSARTGTLTIAGQTLAVTQAPGGFIAAGIEPLVTSGLIEPRGVAVDTSGNVYIADTFNNAIKEWSPETGTVTAIISSGLDQPTGLTLDGTGNLYISDGGNNAIKEWSPKTNTVTSLVSTNLNGPQGIVVDNAGNVYFADTGNKALKEWSPTTKLVTTLVSSGLNFPAGVAIDRAGNVYIADAGDNAVKEWSPTTKLLTTPISSGLNEPDGVAVDGAGNLFIADSQNNAIEEWSPSTKTLTALVSSDLHEPAAIAVDGADNVFFGPGNSFSAGAIEELPRAYIESTEISLGQTAGSGDVDFLAANGSLTGAAVPISNQSWLTVGEAANGKINFSYSANTSIYSRTAQITALGREITFTQSSTPGAVLGTPSLVEGPAAGSDSDLLFESPTTTTWTATSNDSWLQVAAGSVTGTGNATIAFSFDANNSTATRVGTISIAGQTLTVIQAQSGSLPSGVVSLGLPSVVGFASPAGVAVDAAGNVYVADKGGDSIGEWSRTTGILTMIVSSLSITEPQGVAVDGTGNIYFTDTDNNALKEWSPTTKLVTTLVSSGLKFPTGVAVDAAGNVYIADSSNNAIAEWSPSTNALVVLVSSGLNDPQGVAVDALGNVYIADTFNNAIKEWSPVTGIVTTLVSSGLSFPMGVAKDGAGNVYIADTGNDSIKEWSPITNVVTTFAPSLSLEPAGVAVDGYGNLYVTGGSLSSNSPTIDELPQAYLSPAATTVGAAAGTGTIGVVPASEDLTGPLAPVSDQAWLTISAVAGGQIDYAYAANTTSATRTASITVLGQQLSVTQLPATGLMAEIAPVASPRNTAVDSLTITFNDPVAGFILSNLQLTVNGGANLLTSAQTLTTTDNTTWTLGNLTALTTDGGNYQLTISPAGVQDAAGDVMATGVTSAFTVAPWQNTASPLEVTGGNSVQPADALAVINYLNSIGSGPLPATYSGPYYVDVNGDNEVTPDDALLVINYLNAQAATTAAVPASASDAEAAPTTIERTSGTGGTASDNSAIVPHAAVDGSLAMGVSLSTNAQPAVIVGNAPVGLTANGPQSGSASPSSIVTAIGLNQAVMDSLLTMVSRHKSDPAAQSDAVDAVLSDPLLEWQW